MHVCRDSLRQTIAWHRYCASLGIEQLLLLRRSSRSPANVVLVCRRSSQSTRTCFEIRPPRSKLMLVCQKISNVRQKLKPLEVLFRPAGLRLNAIRTAVTLTRSALTNEKKPSRWRAPISSRAVSERSPRYSMATAYTVTAIRGFSWETSSISTESAGPSGKALPSSTNS